MSRGLGYLLLAVVGVGLAPDFARAGCGDYLNPTGLHSSMPGHDASEKSTPKKPCNGWMCSGKHQGAMTSTASLPSGGVGEDFAGVLAEINPISFSASRDCLDDASAALRWLPFTLLRPPRSV